jgi:hypothetical protein
MTFRFDEETRDQTRTLRDEERSPEAYQLIVAKLEARAPTAVSRTTPNLATRSRS